MSDGLSAIQGTEPGCLELPSVVLACAWPAKVMVARLPKKTKPGQGGYFAGTKSVFFKVVEEGEVLAMAAALLCCPDGASPNAKPVWVPPRTTTIALAQAAARWPAKNAWESHRRGCSRCISQKGSHM